MSKRWLHAEAGDQPVRARWVSGPAWIRALVIVLALNAIFFGLAIWVAGTPRERLRERVRSAFLTSDLVQKDFLVLDSRRGNNQYDECLILQMLTNPPAPRLRQAVGPLLYIQDTTATEYCRTLHRLVVEGDDRSGFLETHYTRYWHGTLPVAAGFLIATDLATTRRVLKTGLALSLVLLATVALGSGCAPARIVGLSVAVSGLLLWGLPYVGQLFSHAPGDIVVVLGMTALLAFRQTLTDPRRFVPFCAAFGALVVYLEFLTGQLPIAGGLLLGTAYAVASCAGGARPQDAWRYAVTGLVAFGLGGGLTLIVKQGLAAAILGAAPLFSFLHSLGSYTGSAGAPGAGSFSVVRVVHRLLQKADNLTYGDQTAAIVIAACSVLAWLAAAALAVRNDAREGRFQALSDLFALGAGAAVPAAWILLFQNHTYAHAGFMIRISIVPLALGWAALLWQVHTARRRAEPLSFPA